MPLLPPGSSLALPVECAAPTGSGAAAVTRKPNGSGKGAAAVLPLSWCQGRHTHTHMHARTHAGAQAHPHTRASTRTRRVLRRCAARKPAGWCGDERYCDATFSGACSRRGRRGTGCESRRLRRVRYERCAHAPAVIGRSHSCELSCWQPAMRVPAGRSVFPDAMRAPRTRPARDSPGMGVVLNAVVGTAVAARRDMPCLIKCAVAAREARRRRDSPGHAVHVDLVRRGVSASQPSAIT